MRSWLLLPKRSASDCVPLGVSKHRISLSPIAAVVARQKRAAQQQPAVVATIGKPAAVLEAAPAAGAAPAAAGAGGGANDDDGQNLVDLIQTTIAPETWDVNGGPGSIYYWRNQHVLVIRATDDVHGFIGELTDQLDAAGH